MQNIVITVTPEHMEGAKFWDVWDCPLARALKKRFPDTVINVSYERVHIGLELFTFDSKIWNEHTAKRKEEVTFTLTHTTPWEYYHKNN